MKTKIVFISIISCFLLTGFSTTVKADETDQSQTSQTNNQSSRPAVIRSSKIIRKKMNLILLKIQKISRIRPPKIQTILQLKTIAAGK
ncbi:hypothetical protein [Lactobacillus helveticus]|jgi:hypothetical protein|uniref:hypothetical protein n=1 Tax=Lactobacillus helveticus TaxID=1587 RepID=UPI0015620B1B|nr:hypothetical protein [Lactobacillus helveticus]